MRLVEICDSPANPILVKLDVLSGFTEDTVLDEVKSLFESFVRLPLRLAGLVR